MMRRTALVLGSFLGLTLALSADTGKDAGAKPSGQWSRTVGDNSVSFIFKGSTLHTIVNANGNTIEVDADYGMSKDNVLFGRLSKVIKKGTDEGPSEGDLFSFRLKFDKDMLTVSDFKGSGENSDAAKQLLEGDYQKGKPKE